MIKAYMDKGGFERPSGVEEKEKKRRGKGREKKGEKVKKKGDIYKGTYSGLYCEGCEAFKTEEDLVNGLCPDHIKEPKYIEEQNYFFKLSKYRDEILKHIKENPDFIQPTSRKNEIVKVNYDYE